MHRHVMAAVAAFAACPALAQETALEAALRAGDAAAAAQAIAAGEPVDAAFPGGLTTPLGLAITQGRADLVTLLLDQGASTDRPGTIGMPPLAIAAQSCRTGLEIVNLLLDRGADVNTPGPGGMTPLLIAALMGRDEIVAALLAAGADASAVDVFGDGILNFAIYARDPGQVHVALAAGSGTGQLEQLFLTRGYRAYVWPGPPRCDEAG